MGDTHQRIARGEYVRKFMNIAGLPDVALKWEKMTYCVGTRLKPRGGELTQLEGGTCIHAAAGGNHTGLGSQKPKEWSNFQP
ncbi:hypothetical protein E2C01_022961 [Portunus trituberculatus]|uniref:Uncharacterized protein n=1 Tax=Portunus trituberculatus TaxID=210409 RepID=A0A5B7E8Q1_PORTR|nr:hypothetical protein [Portunus trituberculatus]